MEFFWKQIERALGLWRTYRSALHGRIAWLVVLAGTTVMATPSWLPILAQLLKNNTNLDVTGLDAIAASTEPLYGLITIILGLAYHAFFVLQTRWDQRAATKRYQRQIANHDRPIYNGLTQKLSEQWLRGFTDQLGSDHSYLSKDGYTLDDITRYLSLTTNQFLDSELEVSRKNLLAAFNQLDNFMSVRFFIHPRDQGATTNYWLCMQPEHNVDRSVHVSRDDELFYVRLTDELNNHLDAAIEAYESFTLSAKARLLTA